MTGKPVNEGALYYNIQTPPGGAHCAVELTWRRPCRPFCHMLVGGALPPSWLSQFCSLQERCQPTQAVPGALFDPTHSLLS